jgi:hypothetical protein
MGLTDLRELPRKTSRRAIPGVGWGGFPGLPWRGRMRRGGFRLVRAGSEAGSGRAGRGRAGRDRGVGPPGAVGKIRLCWAGCVGLDGSPAARHGKASYRAEGSDGSPGLTQENLAEADSGRGVRRLSGPARAGVAGAWGFRPARAGVAGAWGFPAGVVGAWGFPCLPGRGPTGRGGFRLPGRGTTPTSTGVSVEQSLSDQAIKRPSSATRDGYRCTITPFKVGGDGKPVRARRGPATVIGDAGRSEATGDDESPGRRGW